MTTISTLMRLLVLLLGTVLASCGGGHDNARDTLLGASPADAVRVRALAAEPAAPFTANGWYWNPQEGGTGFMVEAQGSRMFIGFFMYEEGSGNPVWYAALGDLTDGAAQGDHHFSGDLRIYQGGMALSSRSWTQPTSRSLGPVSIDFIAGSARVAFPGGRVMQAERFCAGGPCTVDPSALPRLRAETGWYWNPAEGGRGVAIETHGANSFIGMFHYNPDGSPVWHIVSATGGSFERVELYTGGQSLTSAYRQPSLDVLSNLRLIFPGPCAGQLQVAGSPPVSLRRFVIDDTRPPGAECRALGTLADVADLSSMSFGDTYSPGTLLYGVIDTPDDADSYLVHLDGYNKTYTFDLMGAASAAGTLANPRLGLYDANLGLIAENDDRDEGTTDARLSLTIPYPGFYRLRVTSSRVAPGTGSFLLKVSGIDPSLRDAPLLPLASLQGAYTGRLRGAAPAQVSLTMAADGTVSGVMTVLHPSRQRVTLSGTMAPDGVLSFGGEGLAAGPIRCQAAAINGGIFGGCGEAGMLTGRAITRVDDAYGPIKLPPSAVVGQPVQLSTTDVAGAYPVTYAWDFGDGSVGEGATPPPHVYARPGLYTVNVTISGDTSPSGTSFRRASLMVFCPDGTLCTDLDEPQPWVTIDTAACTLRSVPPDRPRNYTNGPLLTFTGRASGSSSQQLVSFASGNRRLTEAQVRQSLTQFGYWDQQKMSLACDGRDPCSVGPFGAFTDSPAYRSGPYLELQFLWEQRPLTDPQPVWLYMVVVDRASSDLLSVAEHALTCPGHLGVR